jgi:hypothetical protein
MSSTNQNLSDEALASLVSAQNQFNQTSNNWSVEVITPQTKDKIIEAFNRDLVERRRLREIREVSKQSE